MKRSLLCLLLPLLYFVALAQRDCRQDDYQQEVLRLHPLLHIQYEKIEGFVRTHPLLAAAGTVDTTAVRPVPEKIIIPVVVHILWNSNAQNISDAQVLSQIDVLNKDFSGQNADHNKIPSYFSAVAASCGISFALAKRDPQGNATTGIVRKQTGTGVFSFDDKAKSNTTGGDDAWNADNYLNIWVCNLVSGISGYASAPGGSKENDGVVISTNAFGTINVNGPFNKGRTAVHETGHWLNLRHIWGDASCGDDKVDDTPTQQSATRGCSSGEKFSCGSTAHGDMYMNFMDFTDDACMFMFTKGQQERMRALFAAGGPRNSLLYSTALNGEGLALQANSSTLTRFDLLVYPNPAVDNITLQLQEAGNSIGKEVFICNYMGQVVLKMICTSKLQQLNISGLHAGVYFIKLEEGQTGISKKFIKVEH